MTMTRDDRYPIHGQLEGYWEQGWEGRVEYVLTPAGCSGLHELVWLRDGDRLSIYEGRGDDPRGGRVLWSGTVALVRRRFWMRAPAELRVWNERAQRGVAYATWLGWFCRRPRLGATLWGRAAAR